MRNTVGTVYRYLMIMIMLIIVVIMIIIIISRKTITGLPGLGEAHLGGRYRRGLSLEKPPGILDAS